MQSSDWEVIGVLGFIFGFLFCMESVYSAFNQLGIQDPSLTAILLAILGIMILSVGLISWNRADDEKKLEVD